MEYCVTIQVGETIGGGRFAEESNKSKAPIVSSWKRSKEFGVDPVQVENDILMGGELKDRQGQLHEFFRTSNRLLE
jgi:hypothetical protein